jgi:hypothetical protein
MPLPFRQWNATPLHRACAHGHASAAEVKAKKKKKKEKRKKKRLKEKLGAKGETCKLGTLQHFISNNFCFSLFSLFLFLLFLFFFLFVPSFFQGSAFAWC